MYLVGRGDAWKRTKGNKEVGTGWKLWNLEQTYFLNVPLLFILGDYSKINLGQKMLNLGATYLKIDEKDNAQSFHTKWFHQQKNLIHKAGFLHFRNSICFAQFKILLNIWQMTIKKFDHNCQHLNENVPKTF